MSCIQHWQSSTFRGRGLAACALLCVCCLLSACRPAPEIAFVDLVEQPEGFSLRAGVPSILGRPAALLLLAQSSGPRLPLSRRESYYIPTAALAAGGLQLDGASFELRVQALAPGLESVAREGLPVHPLESWRWLGSECVTASGLPAASSAQLRAGELQLALLLSSGPGHAGPWQAYLLAPDAD
ncbi:hypothetical protein IT575_03510 [bacterium]|nr:hypothetical protein [bacterium]